MPEDPEEFIESEDENDEDCSAAGGFALTAGDITILK